MADTIKLYHTDPSVPSPFLLTRDSGPDQLNPPNQLDLKVYRIAMTRRDQTIVLEVENFRLKSSSPGWRLEGQIALPMLRMKEDEHEKRLESNFSAVFLRLQVDWNRAWIEAASVQLVTREVLNTYPMYDRTARLVRSLTITVPASTTVAISPSATHLKDEIAPSIAAIFLDFVALDPESDSDTSWVPIFRVPAAGRSLVPFSTAKEEVKLHRNHGALLLVVSPGESADAPGRWTIYAEHIDFEGDNVGKKFAAELNRHLELSRIFSADPGFAWTPKLLNPLDKIWRFTSRHYLTKSGGSYHPEQREFFPQPQGGRNTFKFRFPQVRNHSGNGLLIDFPARSLSFRDSPAFYLGQPIKAGFTIYKEPSQGLVAKKDPQTSGNSGNRVRLGALDLDFSASPYTSADAAQFLHWDLAPPEDKAAFFSTESLHFEIGLARALPAGQDDIDEEIYPACDPSGTQKFRQALAALESGNSQQSGSLRDEDIDCQFNRAQPLVISLPRRSAALQMLAVVRAAAEPAAASGPPLRLKVHQTTSSGQPRQIKLELHAVPKKASRGNATTIEMAEDEVVILDSEPFVVAHLRFPSLGNPAASALSTELANWQNFGPHRFSWRLRFTDAQAFTLTLPPQGVGETMDKKRTLGESEVADFRLAPPARIELQERYYRQNYPEAPWNLRRLLADRGRELPGAHLLHLQYELLYGLACALEPGGERSFLRLAELSALVGVPQGPLPLRPRWDVTALEASTSFEQARIRWAGLQETLRQRLGVFEVWDLRRLASLDLQEGVSCWIRDTQNRQLGIPTPAGNSCPEGEFPDESAKSCQWPKSILALPSAQLAHPLATDEGCKSDAAKVADLCGGVTWGFESRNVYNAVMRPDDKWPKASGARVSDLRLSALGGWGHQMAAFDYWRSKIYADVAMGRTYSYTVERIGRIACFWNRAKHVIVYERSVESSAQFARDQHPNRGRAVVRKVAEYVEILQNVRHFPDRDGAAARTSSFVKACKFADDPHKVVRFPVRSDWGMEVGTVGWKVPIWKPGEVPEGLYIKPIVNLTVMASEDGESRPRDQIFANPENLYFYTDTQPPKTGVGDPARDLSNTDEWDPVEGVDYVDEARPAAISAFGDSLDSPVGGGEGAVPVGFGPCTFSLEPSEHKVDLLAERQGDPMGAVLSSLTICRARLSSTPTRLSSALKEVGSNVAAQFENNLAKLKSLTSPAEILGSFSCTTLVVPKGLDEARKKLTDASLKADAFLAELDKNSLDILLDRVRRQFQFPRQIKPDLVATQADIEREIDHAFSALMGLPSPGSFLAPIRVALETAQRELALAVAAAKDLRSQFGSTQWREKPAAALHQVRRYHGLLQAALDKAFAIVDSPPTVVVGSPRALDLRKVVQRHLKTIQGLILESGQLLHRLERWLPDAGTAADAAIEAAFNFFDHPDPQVKDAVSILETAINDCAATLAKLEKQVSTPHTVIQAALDKVQSELKKEMGALVEKQDKNWAELETAWTASVDKLVGPGSESLSAEAQKAFDNFRTGLASATSPLTGFLQELEQQIPADDQLQKVVEDGCTELETKLKELVRAFGDQLLSELGLKEVEALVRGRAKAIQKELEEKLGPGLREARKLLGEVEATADNVLNLARAFGKPPDVSGLKFDKPEVAFFYDAIKEHVDISPVVARAAQVSAIADALKPFGVDLPVEKLGEQLIPKDLKNFDLSSILPNISGMPLKNLFAGIKMPEGVKDRIKVKHGIDKQTRRAWVNTDADFDLKEPATLFSLGPLALSIDQARFKALARLEADLKGIQQRKVEGSLAGDWHLRIGGFKLVTFKKTALQFDEKGRLDFDIEPKNVEMPEALSFVNDLLSSFSKSGLSTRIDATGVTSTLDVPIPDTKIGAFGFAGLRLGASLSLRYAPSFNIGLTANLGRKDAPFNLTIFILGGGGYLESGARYFPSTGKVESTVDLAITASASLGIALGPISGSVSAFVGVTGTYNSKVGGGLNIGLLLMVVGQVSVLSIASAHIVLRLDARYQGGALVATGSISIRIKICWCFTLEVEESVTYTIGTPGKTSAAGRLAGPEKVGRLAALRSDVAPGFALLAAGAAPDFTFDPSVANELVKQYLAMVTEV